MTRSAFTCKNMAKSKPFPNSLDLPSDFVKNITTGYSGGADWLSRLPDLLDGASRRWQLVLGEPFLLSYNYVCSATQKDGSQAVFKIGVPNIELNSEINTLRLYAGQGACQLLAADAEKGMLLLERLRPGMMLATLENDDQTTEIAAQVMKRLHRQVPQQAGFLSLRKWFDKLSAVRTHFNGGAGPFPEKSFALAEGLIHDLFSEQCPQVLLHGDFHHFNILSSERGWLAIDPKGVAGPAEYEVGPLLINPYNGMPEESQAIRRTERRIAILSELLGFERARLRAWAICHSVLSSFWDMADPSSPAASWSWSRGETARAWTEIFIKTKI
jgi:streptomycin 6-kinase